MDLNWAGISQSGIEVSKVVMISAARKEDKA